MLSNTKVMDKSKRNRFNYLIEPCKDLAKNFNLDIVKELVTYQEEVDALDVDGEASSKHMFSDAGTLVQGAAFVYGRKVDYVHECAHSFNMALKKPLAKKKTAAADGDNDNDAMGDDGDENPDTGKAARAKKARRVRTSDDDPLAFVPIPRLTRAYNDREHYKKTIYKPLLDCQFNPLLLREPPSINKLPEELRPLPDTEKEAMCVMGKVMRRVEGVGKFEDFWTLSPSTMTMEEEWINEDSTKELPNHAGRRGGCQGCARLDCPDAGYFTKPAIPYGKHEQLLRGRLPLNTLYLDPALFVVIRSQFLHDYLWVRSCDLMPRCQYWTINQQMCLKEKQQRLQRFRGLPTTSTPQVCNSLEENGLKQELCTPRVMAMASMSAVDIKPLQPVDLMLPPDMAAELNPQNQNDDNLDFGDSACGGGDDEMEVGSHYMVLKGNVFPGRPSSEVEVGRRSAAASRVSVVNTVHFLKSEVSESSQDKVRQDLSSSASDVPRPRSSRIQVPTQSSSLPHLTGAHVALPVVYRDPFAISGPKEEKPRRLRESLRCQNVAVMKEELKRRYSGFENMAARLRNLEHILNTGDCGAADTNVSTDYDDDTTGLTWQRTLANFNVQLLRNSAKNRAEKTKLLGKKSRKCLDDDDDLMLNDEGEDGSAGGDNQPFDGCLSDNLDVNMEDDWNQPDGEDDFEDDRGPLPIGDAIPGEISTNNNPEPKRLTWKEFDDDNLNFPCQDINDLLESFVDDGRDNRDCNLDRATLNAMRVNDMFINSEEFIDKRKQLEKEVADWEDYIIPKLEEELEKKPFDIHTYTGELLDSFDNVGDKQGLPELCVDKEKYEVSRVFMSVLMMANTGNVEITHDPENPINSMNVRLVSRERPNADLISDAVKQSNDKS